MTSTPATTSTTATTSPAHATDPHALTAADPHALTAAFTAALNAGDLDAVLACFAPDATMRTPEGRVISGPEALRAEFATTVAASAHLTNSPRLALPAGDGTRLLVVDWTLAITTPAGTRATPSGTTANIARRSPDGTWRYTLLNPLGTS
jgi:uncharacterized protein (TIGR02246 family)